MALAVALLARTTGARADDVAARGAVVYRDRCAVCHGAAGDGHGDAAYMLLTPPRDFRRGTYRFVSTWDGIATDDDLFQTITRGLPGTQMASFGWLPERDRRALVVTLKAFSTRSWAIPAPLPPASPGEPGTGVVDVPPSPGDAATNQVRATELYRDACATCHGLDGRGGGRTDLVDDTSHPIRPRDFTSGTFKAGATAEALYRRIIVGIPGTPMPTNPWAYGDDAWYLVHYVLAFGPSPR
jgi:cytochrome c oxidase cbb3-type subunit 2